MSELLDFILSHEGQFRRQRLPSLYSDFTLQRQSNPDGFAANINAWQNALAKAGRAGVLPAKGNGSDTLLLSTGQSLLRSLETKEWGVPLALGAVIDEAVSKREMIPYTEYLAARKSIYQRSWAVPPWWLLSWGLRQIGLLEHPTGASKLSTGHFIILRNVEDASMEVLKRVSSGSNEADQVYPMPFFRDEVSKAIGVRGGVSDSDFQIILTYLGRDKSAIIYDSRTVKIKRSGDTSTTLSDQDSTISSLKILIANLNTQVAQLTARIGTLSTNAQTAIQHKNRTSALAFLRAKKVNEATLMQRSDSLAQLEEVYNKIEQATDQVAIVCVMQASTAVLQKLNADVGGIENVENVVEGVGEEMNQVNEIGSALDSGIQGGTMVDEDAVDEELQGMERQAKMDQERKETLEIEKRLASIDVMKKHKPTEMLPPASEKTEDDSIHSGIKVLKRLSLENNESASNDDSNNSHVPAIPMVEPASGS